MNAVMDDVFSEEPWPSRLEQPGTAFLAGRMRSACVRTARLWCEGLRRSEFRPEQFEMEFGRGDRTLPLTLEDGSALEWTGFVDRVDRWTREDSDVLRVVDYKSGNRTLTASGVVLGTQLQLWIYLATVCALSEKETGRPAVPGGIYYAPVGDTFENLKEGSGDREALRMRGWTVDDEAILDATDREVKRPGEESSYVTLDRGASGKFSSTQVKSPEDFRLLRDGALRTAVRLAEGMKAGVIPPRPVTGGMNGPCDYCEHKALCSLRGAKETVKPLNNKEAMARLRGEDA
jgi:ATP-dependent helicase/nuclease subunit B